MLVSLRLSAQIHREHFDQSALNETAPHPRNLKVLDEHRDGKGNIVRTVIFEQGMMKVTQTIIMPEKVTIGQLRVPINPDTLKKDSVTIMVDKSNYVVQVYYRRRMIRAYKAVFGPHPQQDKTVEGDRCTPEGWFKIVNMNPASKYDKFMLLSYPNDSAYAKFNRLKAKGVLPASARIGGSVGIHGIWPKGDDMIDMGVGWTDGMRCYKE